MTMTAAIVQAAKEDSDTFLTALINQELAQKSDGRGDGHVKTQCTKAESKGTAAVEAAAAEVGGVQPETGRPEPMELELCGSSGEGVASSRQKGNPAVSEFSVGVCMWFVVSSLRYLLPRPWPVCTTVIGAPCA